MIYLAIGMINNERDHQRSMLTACICIILLVAGISFAPVISAEFITWDDPGYVTENMSIRSFSQENLKVIFSSHFISCYSPIPILSYAIEYRFFKLNGSAYHLTNYLLHLLVVLLVFYFIYRLSNNVWIAFVAALMFGVHPVHVESVAWVSERKGLLCGIFYLSSLLSYLSYLVTSKRKYYFLCLLFTVMALMSKPVAVTIPLTLILLDYMKGRKINKETLLEKWPFFIIAFILAVVTVIFQEPDWRIAQENYYPYFISKTIIFYLHKIIIPIKLSAIYPYHNVSPQHIAHIKYYILAIAIIVSIIAYSRKYTKVIMFGSLFFFITLVPTMRIIPVSYTFAADRYMYIPSIGIFYVCSFIFVKLYLYLRVRAKLLSYSLLSCLILWLTFLSIYTWNRSYVWRDSVTFYEEGIRSSPRYAPFYNNLGAAYRKNGEFEKSIGVLKRALELDPNLSGAWGHMGMVYLDLGKHGDALHALNKGLEICPNSDRMLYLKGLSYAKCNERKKAIEVWCKTIEINPACKEAYYSISLAYYHMNDYANSLKYMELARKHGAKIDTNFIEALLPHRRSNP